MRHRTAQEIGDEPDPDELGLLAEFERVGQTMTEVARDPEPGQIAQCFRCGKFAVIGEDLQLRMPTTDEQLAINTNAHLTESQIVWASYTGAHRKWADDLRKRAKQFDRKSAGGKKAWGINPS
jgi:hypothetical protein